MINKLFIISKRPEDLAFATEAAGIAELQLLTADDPTQGAPILAAEEPCVIIMDVSSPEQYEEMEKSIQDTVGLFSEKVNPNNIHFISSQNLEKVQYLVQSPLFGHFIHRNFTDAKTAGAQYGRILRATIQDRAFGLEGILKPGTKIQNIKLASTNQKQDAVEAIKNYLIAAKFQSRMATVIANAVDELLMNAMFDAPVDDIGKPLFSATARNTVFKLEGKNAVEMNVGYDGELVAVTAVDYFGSLDKVKLLTHISKIYTEEEYKVRTSVAGAGIGLATVFRSGGSFLFVSESRVKTEVTVFFRRTDSFREFKDQFRFISTQFYF